jgi:hypothetical protein
MKALLLSLTLGVASLGLLAVAPSQAEAQRFWRRPMPYYGSYYYSPGYSYWYTNPSYSYSWGPSYYTPGYMGYYGYYPGPATYYSPGYRSYYAPGYYGYYSGY